MLGHVQGMLRSGEIGAVLEIIEDHFKTQRSPSPENLGLAVVAVEAAAKAGAWSRAVEWAETGLAMRLNEPESLGRIQLFLGVACMYLGNVYRSEKALATFLRTARKTPSLQHLIPYGLYNWATLMRFMRRHDEETRRFRQAAGGFAELGDLTHALQCRLAIAWSALLRGQPEPALSELQALAADLATCQDEEVQVNAKLAWALYESLTGNVSGSDAMLQDLLANHTPLAGQHADILWLLGCNSRARGETGLALQYAAEAHHVAVQDPWPLTIERIEALKLHAMAN